MFTKASENSDKAIGARKKRNEGLLKYGISFLDDALQGITKNELILIGAHSGIGKTSFCCNVAYNNISNGKKVHYVALEAEDYEIESRLQFKIISDMFFSDPNRPQLKEKFSFANWYRGNYFPEFEKYEKEMSEFFKKSFSNLKLHYKRDKYGINEFIESVILSADETDLIIVDHVHYFDSDEENENKAIKQIAHTARMLAIENGKPIILVGHLRKKDRNNPDMVPDMYEFHGSSDLYKIATTVITFSPGARQADGNFITYFRIPKYRIDGGVTRFLGKTIFNPKKGSYEETYKIGSSNQSKDSDFNETDEALRPEWSKSRNISYRDYSNPGRGPIDITRGQGMFKNLNGED